MMIRLRMRPLCLTSNRGFLGFLSPLLLKKEGFQRFRGLDLEAVLHSAQQRGLIASDVSLSDYEVGGTHGTVLRETHMPQANELMVILGLSDDPDRYSHMAMKLLQQYGYRNIIGVNPALTDVEGVKVVPKVEDIPERPHTLTVYVNPRRLEPMIPGILKLNPQRIILNPGTESKQLMQAAQEQGIEVEAACTLVMLRARQF
jgi:predicted CoA-binding protein